MGIELRPYQAESVDALWDWFNAGNPGNPLVIAPVGAGKSILMADFIRRVIDDYSEARIIAATHSATLVSQNHAKLKELWPSAPAGIYAAGLGRREIRSQVLFGTVQSLFRKAFDLDRRHLLLVDECHTISRKDASMWGKFIADLQTVNHDLRVVGYSGTAWRQDTGSLIEGEGAMFSDIAHEIKMADLIQAGYLAPLVSVPSDVQINLKNVAIRGGEYVPAALENAAEQVINELVADAVERGKDRRTWLAFAAGIKNAFHMRDCIRQYGISCETVTGETPEAERNRLYAALAAGHLRCITNVGVATTGTDIPPIDMLIMGRPTKSSSLAIQMAGRGMRLSPATGKVDCLFLDYSSLLKTHGCIDTIEAPRPRAQGGGEAPSKQCPECETRCRAAALMCAVCGFEFPPHEVKIVKVADVAPVLSSQIKPEWVEVSDVTYAKHSKKDKPDSLVVNYHCGLARHREWICLEHIGFARTKAVQWWTKRAPGQYIPKTVSEALDMANDLPQPTAIQVRPSGKFTEIIGAKFE